MTSEALPSTNAPSETSPRKRRRGPLVGALLFVLVLAGLFAWFAQDKPLDQARRRIREGNVPMAVRAFEEHMSRHPGDWAVTLEYGTFLKQHDAARALQVLQQIPKTSPEFLLAARQIAHIALVGERYELAEAAVKTLYDANPQDPAAALGLAEIYHRQGKDKDALPLAQKAIELQPERLQSQILLAEIYFGVGRASEMAQPLRKVLHRDPNNKIAHLNLAYSLTTQADFANARREAEWSREHDSNNPQVWRVLAQIERDDGNIELALKYVRHGLELSPNELECRLLEGQILNFQKKFQEAYDRMYPVYQQHRREQRVVGVLAQATRFLGRKEEATEFQKLLVELGNETYRGEKKPEQ